MTMTSQKSCQRLWPMQPMDEAIKQGGSRQESSFRVAGGRWDRASVHFT